LNSLTRSIGHLSCRCIVKVLLFCLWNRRRTHWRRRIIVIHRRRRVVIVHRRRRIVEVHRRRRIVEVHLALVTIIVVVRRWRWWHIIVKWALVAVVRRWGWWHVIVLHLHGRRTHGRRTHWLTHHRLSHHRLSHHHLLSHHSILLWVSRGHSTSVCVCNYGHRLDIFSLSCSDTTNNADDNTNNKEQWDNDNNG
jgi:hypothetical protein